jgi:hypothetical protein
VLTSHRIVLLALIAPILAVGVVLWFLLPGSIAGLTYTPSQYNREAHLQPVYWSQHRATVRGYLWGRCIMASGPMCFLIDSPRQGSGTVPPQILQGIRVLPQAESGWHAVLRRLAPGLLTAPFPTGAKPGQRVTITGTLQSGYTGTGTPVLVPAAL